MEKLHIGIDFHGVIDHSPEVFSRLSKQLISDGMRVSIITGQEWEKIKPKVDKAGVFYTDWFSIVDYHKSLRTRMWKDKKGTFWMAKKTWERSKGDYIEKEHVDVHFDDSVSYARFVPDFCTFVLVPKSGFHEFVELFFDDAYFNNRKRWA